MTQESVFDPKADSPLSDEALRGKKDRYAQFDARNIISRIAKKSLSADIIRIEPLGVGANAFDHLVFRVYTDKGLRVVFRLNTDELVAEDFLVEKSLYDMWHKHGVPSPEVYDISLRSKKSDPDHILMEHVGTNDLEKHLVQYPKDAASYAYHSGAFLKRIHDVPIKGFGMLAMKNGELQGSQNTWKEAIRVRMEETLSYLVKHGLLTSKQEKDIKSAFARHEDLLAMDQGVTLHGDYHNANIMIDDTNGKVVAAIDLSQAKAGDPLYDIAFYGTYVSPEIFSIFCDGYFDRSSKPRNFKEKIALYQLRIYMSKAKLRKRFGYDDRIGLAIEGIIHSLKQLL